MTIFYKICIGVVSTIILTSCGGGGGSTTPSDVPNTSSTKLQSLSEIYKDEIVEKLKNTNFKNIMEEANALSKDNYVDYYKRINAMRFVSIPDLNVTFELKKSESNSSGKRAKRHKKVIYENIWSRKDEYECRDGGTVSKEVNLSPRSTLEADTYKTGDVTTYNYDRCDMGNVTYGGEIEYKVGTSNSGVTEITSENTFGATPLGTFDSVFNHLSIESETQIVTLNGTIKYDAIAQRTPEPNSKLTSLDIKYSTIGEFVVTVYDKSTSETITLTFNGKLDQITYTSSNGVEESGASVIDLGVVGTFTYRRTSDYSLRVEQDGQMFTVQVYDNLSGLTGENGAMQPPRPIGYDFSNASGMSISNHRIIAMVLADGTTKYILDEDADFFPEDTQVVGTPAHTLPLSDADLMQGIVVIGFDTCVPTNRLRQRLEELGIEYHYINMQGTQQDYDVFKWFNVSGVPYMGIDGNYFGGAFYTKENLTIYLNLHGYDMNKTAVVEARNKQVTRKSAALKFKENYDEVQTHGKHTAIAVANDTPYVYYIYRAWDWNTVEEAKDFALSKCEEARQGNDSIHSKCRFYSIDGVIQADPILRDIP